MNMIETEKQIWFEANWAVPEHIRAGTTLRSGGYSKEPYRGLNLAAHVGDKTESVIKNRQLLIKQASLPSEPVWLNQTHSKRIICLDKGERDRDADASYTTEKKRICVIMTADCVPLLFCNQDGSKIAAVHAGWRGICAGIIEHTINILTSPETLSVWIGPCISGANYQVGEDVYQHFSNYSKRLEQVFDKTGEQQWNCDLVKASSILMKDCGVEAIYQSELCSYGHSDLFFSHRREGRTGRMASMIWMA